MKLRGDEINDPISINRSRLGYLRFSISVGADRNVGEPMRWDDLDVMDTTCNCISRNFSFWNLELKT